MMLSQILIFIAAALAGIHCQKVVTYLSIREGSVITIPCIYTSRHIHNEKYLCRCSTNLWKYCQKVISTDQPTTSKKYSILDDKNRQVFSVTIRDITKEDSCFMCGVTQYGCDFRYRVNLKITSGVPNLYVYQENITAVLGQSVTVLCHYNQHMQFVWCKFGRKCISSSTIMDGVKVRINAQQTGAKITMSGLQQRHSGWYLCQNGGFQFPVNIILTEVTPPSPTTSPSVPCGGATHLSTAEPTVGTDKPINSGTAETENNDQQSNPFMLILVATITTFVLLIISALGVIAAWELKCHCCRCCRPRGYIIPSERSSNKKKVKLPEASVVSPDTSQPMTSSEEGSVIDSTVSEKS